MAGTYAAARIDEKDKTPPQGGPAIIPRTLRMKEEIKEGFDNDNKNVIIIDLMVHRLIKEIEFVNELEKYQKDLGRDVASFLAQNPKWERAIKALNLSPDTTLAPVLPGEERHLVTQEDLPDKAPALWTKDKQPGDTPPDFIQRHYGCWIGKGFARNDLRRLDPQLYRALYNWQRTNKLPEGLDLPTKSESIARTGSEEPPPETVEAMRLAWRLQKRRQSAHRHER